MTIRYDVDLEELAYSVCAEDLKKSADVVIEKEVFHGGRGYEEFFEAGQSRPGEECSWVTWHGDGETALLFFGSMKSVFDRVRSLPRRESD